LVNQAGGPASGQRRQAIHVEQPGSKLSRCVFELKSSLVSVELVLGTCHEVRPIIATHAIVDRFDDCPELSPTPSIRPLTSAPVKRNNVLSEPECSRTVCLVEMSD
jgi:hypothetical protein